MRWRMLHFRALRWLFCVRRARHCPFLLLGAGQFSGVVGVLIIEAIVNYTRIKADAALGIVLSVFFWRGYCVAHAYSAE